MLVITLTNFGVNLSNEDWNVIPFHTQPSTRTSFYTMGARCMRVFSSKSNTNLQIETVHDEITGANFTPIYITSDNLPVRDVSINLATALSGVGEIIVQIGNEPNYATKYNNASEYAEAYDIVQQTLSGIKSDIKFMTAGIGVWVGHGNLTGNPSAGLDYLTEVVDSGAQVDYVSFHYYCTDQSIYDGASKLEILNRAQDIGTIHDIISNATGVPTCCTEFGWGSYLSPDYSDDTSFIDDYFSYTCDGLANAPFGLYWFAEIVDDQSFWQPLNKLCLLNKNTSLPQNNYYGFQDAIPTGEQNENTNNRPLSELEKRMLLML